MPIIIGDSSATGDTSGDFFDEIIPDIIEIFPLSMWRDILKSSAKDLKTAMHEYYEGVENL